MVAAQPCGMRNSCPRSFGTCTYYVFKLDVGAETPQGLVKDERLRLK